MFEDIVEIVICVTIHMMGISAIVALWTGFGIGIYYLIRYLICSI